MKVAVLDHGAGNLRSVAKAFEAAGAAVEVTRDWAAVEECDGLCVPGQGTFGRCMDGLRSTGADAAVKGWVDAGRPYFGICLGMQVLFDGSDEQGPCEGLGMISGWVRALKPAPDVRVPHIGWNEADGEYYYFDHSYAVFPADGGVVTARCRHGEDFAAAIAVGNVTAVQFHPEKSGAAGIGLLRGWMERL